MTIMTDAELAKINAAGRRPPSRAQQERWEREDDRAIGAAWLFHDYLQARAEARGTPLKYELDEELEASEDWLVSSLLGVPSHTVLGVTIEVKRKYIYLTDPDQPSDGFLKKWLDEYQWRDEPTAS